MPAADERSLHRAVLAGDEHAWRTLYDTSFAGLDAYVVWRCAGMRDLADDVTQQTWLTAVRRIREFDPDRGQFLAWLRGIAANVVRAHLRTRLPDRLSGDHHLAPADASPEATEQAEQIVRALAALPERYEEVLRAKYLEGLSVERIARDWATTPKTIESLLTRARQAFRAAYLRLEDPRLHEAES